MASTRLVCWMLLSALALVGSSLFVQADAQSRDPALVFHAQVQAPLLGGTVWRERQRGRRGTLTDIATLATSTSGWSKTTLRPGGQGELRFDGADDYVVWPPQSAYTITGDITLMAWVKLAALGEYGIVVGKVAANDTLHDYMLVIRDTNAFAFYGTALGDYQNSTLTVPDTQWHHLAVSRRGSLISFYLDSRPAGTATQGSTLGANPYNLYVGTDRTLGPDAVNFFRGALDEVRVYARGLSQAEVSAVYRDTRVGRRVPGLEKGSTLVPTPGAATTVPRRSRIW